MNRFIVKRVYSLGIVLVLATITGCGEEKESLHEMDHVTPAHWPGNLQDAASKISERVQRISAKIGSESDLQLAETELRELIEWVPEVAADSDLSEEDWLPIYNASEELRKQSPLLAPGSMATKNLDDLCDLLRNSQAELEKQLASLEGRSNDSQASDPSGSELEATPKLESIETE